MSLLQSASQTAPNAPTSRRSFSAAHGEATFQTNTLALSHRLRAYCHNWSPMTVHDTSLSSWDWRRHTSPHSKHTLLSATQTLPIWKKDCNYLLSQWLYLRITCSCLKSLTSPFQDASRIVRMDSTSTLKMPTTFINSKISTLGLNLKTKIWLPSTTLT